MGKKEERKNATGKSGGGEGTGNISGGKWVTVKEVLYCLTETQS